MIYTAQPAKASRIVHECCSSDSNVGFVKVQWVKTAEVLLHAPSLALMEWRRDQTGGANKLPPLQKDPECSCFNNPPSVVTIKPRKLLIQVKCSSGCRHQSPKRPTSVEELSSLKGRLPQYILLFLFQLPPPQHHHHCHHHSLSLPPSFLCSNHSVTSGCRCQSSLSCVCWLQGARLRGSTQHVSCSLTGAEQHGWPCSLQSLPQLW